MQTKQPKSETSPSAGAKPRAWKKNITRAQQRALQNIIDLEGPEIYDPEKGLATDPVLKQQARLWFESWVLPEIERAFREA